MKRSFSIIALLVAMIFVFTACGSAPVPELTERWGTEIVSYKITKATENNVKDFENEVPSYSEVPGAQVEPVGVDGTLSYSMSIVDGNSVLYITMEVSQTYDKDDLPENWKETLNNAGWLGKYVEGNDTVSIQSSMYSSAVFGAVYDKKDPVSSEKAVQSVVVYYNEKTEPSMEVNNFVTKTTYEDGKANSTFDDKTGKVDNREDSISVDLGDNFVFDNEAMLFAIRAIDMEMLVDAQTMDLNLYNSVDQELQTVAVTIDTADYKLDDNSDDTYYRVGVNLADMSGYAYYMYFEQKEKISPASGIGDRIPQQQLVEMNSGYMHFERV